MATGPLICNTIDFQGVIFNRCDLQVIKGTTVVRDITLCDVDIIISNYTVFSGCVYPNASLLLNASQLGEISFILIKATYPSTLLVASRFIDIIYKGTYLPMSVLTILTGNPQDVSPYLPGTTAWDLDPADQGGMVLYNPQSVRVNVDVILASNIIT